MIPAAVGGVVDLRGGPADPSTLALLLGGAGAGGESPVAVSGAVFGRGPSADHESPAGADRVAVAARGALLVLAAGRLAEPGILAARLDLPAETPAGDLFVAAFRRWGERWVRTLLDHLPGGFVLAAWDGAARRLVLARDPTGERSLYYRLEDGRVLFASEPASLARAGKSAAPLDRPRLLAHVLGVLPDPSRSYFAGVIRLPEGSQAVLDPGGVVAVEPYWSWTESRGAVGPPAAAVGEGAPEELFRRLRRATARRLAIGGGNGILLSGGLDSTAVAIAADAELAPGTPLAAFTWASAAGDGIDEREQSGRFLASRPRLVEHPVGADDLGPLTRYPEAWSDPNAPDTNAYPDLLWATLERARGTGVTTLLNGIGGDPVVGWTAPELALLGELRWGVLARKWRGRLPWHWRLAAELRRTLLPMRGPRPLTPEAIRLAREEGLLATLPQASLTSRSGFRRHLLAQPMQAQTLERFERLSRRAGVAVVAPWHDRELATLVLALPHAALDASPPGKSLLRTALASRLPADFLAASTRPFAVSELRRAALCGQRRRLVERLLGESRLSAMGLVDRGELYKLLHEYCDINVFNSTLWRLVTAESWLSTLDA